MHFQSYFFYRHKTALCCGLVALLLLVAGADVESADLTTRQAEMPGTVMQPPFGINENQEAVVQLELDGEVILEGIDAIDISGRLYLPVCIVTEALTLGVKCDGPKAYGFVLHEGWPFVIDFEEGYVISERKPFKLSNEVFRFKNELYASIDAMSKWFPVDFTFDNFDMSVRAHAREPLPIQALEKRQRRAANRPVQRQYEVNLNDATTPRRLISIPAIDVTSQVTASNQNSQQTSLFTQQGLEMSFDMLYLTNQTYITVDHDRLTRFDSTLSRTSEVPFGGSLLPVTQLMIGSLQAPAIDGIGTMTQPMYGVLLSNKPVSAPTKFLTHDINGYLLEGWDAELFHNGIPIAYQPPSRDGMYHFTDLRVLYGMNDFRVVMHGPYGETREVRQRFISDATLAPGELQYTMSASQEVQQSPSATAGPGHEANITATADYGLVKGVTGSGSLVRWVDQFGKEAVYASIGTKVAHNYNLYSLDLVQSLYPATGQNGQLLTFRGSRRTENGVSLDFEQRLLFKYESAQFPKDPDRLTSVTSIKADTSYGIYKNIQLPLRFGLGFNTRQSGAVEPTAMFRASGGWNGWNTAVDTSYSKLMGVTTAGTVIQISTKLRDINIRGQAGLQWAPSVGVSMINLNADKAIMNGYILNTGVSHDSSSQQYNFKIGIAKRFGMYGFMFTGTADQFGEYTITAGINVSVSADTYNKQILLSPDNLASCGVVAVGAYNDSGPLHAAGFLVNGHKAVLSSGNNDLPVITGLAPDVPVDITVDLSTIEDPFMVPEQDGCRIVPRRGVESSCQIKMITGGEIDGMVYGGVTRNGNQVLTPLRGVSVDLVSTGSHEKKVASTITQESGYYLFRGVMPGNYAIRVADGDIVRLKASRPEPLNVTMPSGGDLVTVNDLVLMKEVFDAIKYTKERVLALTIKRMSLERK